MTIIPSLPRALCFWKRWCMTSLPVFSNGDCVNPSLRNATEVRQRLLYQDVVLWIVIQKHFKMFKFLSDVTEGELN